MKKIDIKFSICISFLFIMVILSNYLTNLNFAMINVFFSIVPSIYIMCKYKFRIKKNIYSFILILMSVLKLLSIVFHVKDLDFNTFIIDFAYFLSFFINSIGFCILKDNIKNIDNREHGFRYTCLVIIFFIVIFCVYNIITNISQFQYFQNSAYRYNIKFSSFYNNRNNFATILLVGILVLHISKRMKYLNSKKIFPFLLCIFLFNLVLTMSRTAIISLIVFYIILYLYSKGNKYKKIFLLLTFIVFFVYLFMQPEIVSFVDNFLIRKDAGLTSRKDIWKAGLILAKDCILFGYGESLSTEMIYDLSGNYYFHNVFIKYMVSDGILFGILYIFLNCIILYDILKKNNNKVYFLASFLSILAYGITEHFEIFSFGLMNLAISIIYIYIPLISGEVKENEK